MNIPPIAQAKLRAFEAAARGWKSVSDGTMLQINELHKELHYKPDNPARPEIEAEIARLEPILAQQQARYMRDAQLVARLGDWLHASSRTELVDARQSKPSRKKGETAAQSVARIRQEIADHQAEIVKVNSALPPVAELRKQARDFVRGLAIRGKPSIVTGYDKFKVTFATGADTPMMNVAYMLAWFDEAALVKRFEAEIDQMPKPALALTATERSERWAQLKDELAALERSEEKMIAAAAEEGTEILRRIDADPQAVLGVAQKAKAANVA